MIGTLFFYNSILLSSTLFVYVAQKARRKIVRLFFLIIAFLIIFVPSALRYHLGIDILAYEYYFNVIAEGGMIAVEPGYYFLNILVSHLGLEFQYLVGLCSFLTYLFVFLSYPKRNTVIFHFFFMTCFYFYTYTYIRQMLAFSIVLFGLMAVYKGYKVRRLVFSFLVGSLFHVSAILYSIYPIFMSSKGKSLKIIRLSFIVFLFVVLLTPVLGHVLIHYVFNSDVARWLGYAHFSSSDYNHANVRNILRTGVFYALRILPAFVCFYYYKVILKNNKNNKYLLVTIVLCGMFYALSLESAIFHRAGMVFGAGFIFVPYLIYTHTKFKYKTLFVIYLVIGWTAFFNNTIIVGKNDWQHICGGQHITPYVSVFNKKDSKRQFLYSFYYSQCREN